jgi:hypothetical protein
VSRLLVMDDFLTEHWRYRENVAELWTSTLSVFPATIITSGSFRVSAEMITRTVKRSFESPHVHGHNFHPCFRPPQAPRQAELPGCCDDVEDPPWDRKLFLLLKVHPKPFDADLKTNSLSMASSLHCFCIVQTIDNGWMPQFLDRS